MTSTETQIRVVEGSAYYIIQTRLSQGPQTPTPGPEQGGQAGILDPAATDICATRSDYALAIIITQE